MVTKQSIRNEIYEKRRQVKQDQMNVDSHLICQKLMALPAFKEAAVIYTYVALEKEVDTKEIIDAAWAAGKKVAVPKVSGSELHFFEINDYDQLAEGYFGVREPKDGCPLVKEGDALMIMPGVAFDKKRHRAGYGKGFYDRYLRDHSKHLTIAVAFDFQIVAEVPFDAFDILPQMLITPTKIYR